MIPAIEQEFEDRLKQLDVNWSKAFFDENWKQFRSGRLILFVRDYGYGRVETVKHTDIMFFDIVSGRKIQDDTAPW
jgi:hypothetical protein